MNRRAVESTRGQRACTCEEAQRIFSNVGLKRTNDMTLMRRLGPEFRVIGGRGLCFVPDLG